MIPAKRRARRIAADEAHSWARNLRLRNPYAKLVLCMLTQYVDGDGICFVSIATLADDTELAANTVRDRLTWLENMGAIARTRQWIDQYGHRNGEGRGRQTSDNIRLLIELDEDGIEARAAEKARARAQADPPPDGGSAGASDPAPRGGSADDEDSAGTPLGLRRPSNSVEGLISEPEPEPEFPPKGPPPGDLNVLESDSVSSEPEPEHFPEFWQRYPGRETMQRGRALEVFVAMSAEERRHARAAAPLLAAALERAKRRPRDAYKWLAERGWLEFPQAKIQAPTATPQRRIIKHAELEAVQVALKIANLRPLSTISVTSEETGRSTDASFWSRAIGADLLALAPFAHQDSALFDFVEEGTPRFAAWRDRLQQWIGQPIEAERKWLEDWNPAVHGLPALDPNFKLRKSTRGLRVPAQWPPRADGSWSTAGESE